MVRRWSQVLVHTSQFLIVKQLPCGPNVEEHVEKIKPFLDAGFDEIALVQIGVDHQKPFFEWAEKELLPALREL